MLRYLVIVLILIFATLSWMYFGIGVPKIYSENLPEEETSHIYDNPERSIENITLFAFYFVPKNKTDKQIENWQSILTDHLEQLKNFHNLQLQGRSDIEYRIFPKPIIGLNENLSYDTESTQFGNPNGLIAISEEINSRVFDSAGDLHDSNFKENINGSYPVMLIIYEGVGASGGVIYDSQLETAKEIAESIELPESVVFVVDIEDVDGFFLLNREFLTGVNGTYGNSTFVHEFYHTLGVPDFYIPPEDTPTSGDIMGLGRKRPLEQTYIDGKILQKLGL